MPIKNNKQWRFMLLASLLVAGLYACSDEEHLKDLNSYVATLKKAVTIHKKPDILANIHVPKAVTFQATGKERDPFEDEQDSYFVGGGSDPLTAFAVKQYQLQGTLERDNQIYAIIKAPDNKIYQLTIQDRIGNHYGRIIEIYPNQIKVEETVSQQEVGGMGKGTEKRIVTLQTKGES